MKHWDWLHVIMALLIALAGLGMVGGCDSGKKVADEVTGNRAVKQYHKSKKDIEDIAAQHAERYESIPDDDNEQE